MFSLSFDLTAQPATLTAHYVRATETRNLTAVVTDPAGTVYPLEFASDAEAKIDLPLTLNGGVIYGDYRVRFTDPGAATGPAEDEGTYPLLDRSSNAYPLHVMTSALTASISVQDAGSYVSGALVERTFLLDRPAIRSLDVSARSDLYRTLNQDRKEIAVGYAGVPYSVFLTGRVTAVVGRNINITEHFHRSGGVHTLSGGQSLTSISRRVRDYVADELSLAAAQNQPVAPRAFSQVVLLTTLLSRLLAGVHVQDTAAAQETYRRIQQIIGQSPAPSSGAAGGVERIGLDGSRGYPGELPQDIVRGQGEGLSVALVDEGRYAIELSESLQQLAALIEQRPGGGIDLALTPEDYQAVAVASALDVQQGTSAQVPQVTDPGEPTNNSEVRVRAYAGRGGRVEVLARLEIGPALYSGEVLALLAAPLAERLRPARNTHYATVFDGDGDAVAAVHCRGDGQLILRGKRPRPDEPLPERKPTEDAPTYRYSFSLSYNPRD